MVLTEDFVFPDPEEALDSGLLAVGGDLQPERLLLAYRSGIFPWYDNKPILWWSPDPRMVLYPKNFRLSKSLRRTLNKNVFDFSFNKAFDEVIRHCAEVRRSYQKEHATWITSEMIEAYSELHKAGHAMSVEVWKEGKLVGGLYGIDLPEKKIFCGESMFSLVSDASKAALYHLCEYVMKKNYQLIDCQLYSKHLASMGGELISREDFLKYLNRD